MVQELQIIEQFCQENKKKRKNKYLKEIGASS